MTLIQRCPILSAVHSEWQTLECSRCLNKIERSIDRQAELHRK